MAHLRLNGYTVPIIGAGDDIMDIGADYRRAFDGSLITEVRNRKRKWAFKSKPLTEMQATGLIALVQGRGQKFGFADQYSGSGLKATANVATFATTSADGLPVYNEGGYLDWAFASSTGTSIAVESGATNVLNAIVTNGPNICTGTDTLGTTGGFASINGATIASNTANYWQGARSVSVVTDAIGADTEGVRTAYATVSANATVTGTVYVKGTGNVVTRLVQNSAAPAGIATSATIALSTSYWRRITLTGTLTGGNTTIALDVVEAAPDSGLTFYCDGFQIEQNAFATSWVAGTRAAGTQSFGTEAFTGWTDFTVNAWALTYNVQATDHVMWRLSNSSSDYIECYRFYAMDSIRIAAPTAGDLATYSPLTAGVWNMITAVIRVNAETGENAVTLYKNGASVATGSLSGFSGLTTTSTVLYVGYDGTSRWWNQGKIDTMRIVPYAASATEVAAWYTYQTSHDLPILYADGDFTNDTTVNVLGEVTRIATTPHFSTAWRTNSRVVEFTLEEV